MAKQGNIDLEIQFVNVLGEMVQAYQEIYVVQMRKVRDKVVSNRTYMDGLTEVFGELKAAYAEHVKEKTLVDEKILLLLKKQNKPVAVLMTAKRKLSGDINHKIFSEFETYINKTPDADIVIVGSIGRDLYLQKGYKRKYKFFDLSEDQVSINDLKPVLEYISPYEQTMIFYGKFSSLVRQNQASSDIRGERTVSDIEMDKYKGRYYLFEPTLEELLIFFETQIFASLFKQTAHESYLAQIGSRIQALQSATSNIENKMTYLDHESRKLMKRKKNKKQLQNLVGMRLWNR